MFEPTNTIKTAAYAAVVDNTETGPSSFHAVTSPHTNTSTDVEIRAVYCVLCKTINHIGPTRKAPPISEIISRLRKSFLFCFWVVSVRVPPIGCGIFSRGGTKPDRLQAVLLSLSLRHAVQKNSQHVCIYHSFGCYDEGIVLPALYTASDIIIITHRFD